MIGAASVVAVGRSHVLEREILYTTPGTYTWTCPAGVNYVSVVCIGGGGGGMYYNNSSSSHTYAMGGGGGGGLAWMNNISVTPGNNYSVVVGAGGSNGAYPSGSTAGEDSLFWSFLRIKAFGGSAGTYNTDTPGGSYYLNGGYGTARGGGVGGTSYSQASSGYGPAGGGGAGGYSGNGGHGRDDYYTRGDYGSGGGGGGGGAARYLYSTVDHVSGGGGGTGVYGEGANGTATTFGNGIGGSGGGNGDAPDNGTNSDSTGAYTKGGDYGGGGGGSASVYWGYGGNGGDGVVRLIYRVTGLETNLEFPSTDTGIKRLQTVI